MKKIGLYLIAIALVMTPMASLRAASSQVIFPKGPYDSQLLQLNILKAEAADFAAITLPDGTIRGYGPNVVENAFTIFDSKDGGKTFTRIGNAEFSGDNLTNYLGQPRIVKLNDGKFHFYSNSLQGISCFSSTDGLKFVVDKLLCIPRSIIPEPPHYKEWRLSGLSSVVMTKDGKYRAYFADEGVQNDFKFPPHHIYSVTSTDGVNWVRDPGLRAGPAAKGATSVAIHPEAIQHADGSVTIFYRSWPQQNQVYATSKDGLNFSDERILWWKTKNPIAGYGNEGGDPSLVLDKSGKIVLFQGTWIENNGLGVSSITLKPGKGTKFGEEVGRDIGPFNRFQTEYINCVASGTPSDPAFGRISLMASNPTDLTCPDNYLPDQSKPTFKYFGPKYSKTTQCIWSGSTNPPFMLYERYFSGAVPCPDGYKVGSGKPVIWPQQGGQQPDNQKPGDAQPSAPPMGTTCYAKTGMVVNNPKIELGEANATCPSGYTTTPNKAKQTSITCVVLPGFKVENPEMTFTGIGTTPKCPKGYKKK